MKRLGAVGALIVPRRAALAQPMMMDPSKMSGIPRPDPQVPPGTITVRLIRGELSNRMAGVDVGLAGPDGKAQRAEDRRRGPRDVRRPAAQGPIQARAADGDQKLASQPIELQRAHGLARDARVPADGRRRRRHGAPDKSLPAGTLVVRAEDGAARAAPASTSCSATRAQASERCEEPTPRPTTPARRSSGLDAKPTSGYLVEVVATARASRQAVPPAGQHGRAHRHRRAAGVDAIWALHIGPGSHIIVEVSDDSCRSSRSCAS